MKFVTSIDPQKPDAVPSTTDNIEIFLPCRICQMGPEDQDDLLINPCKCSGTLMYCHPSCLIEWLIMRESKKDNLDPELMSKDLIYDPATASVAFETLTFLKYSSCELCNQCQDIQFEGRTVFRKKLYLNFKNWIRIGFLIFQISIAILNLSLAYLRFAELDLTFQLMTILGVVFIGFSIQMGYICVKSIFLDTNYYLTNKNKFPNKTQPIQTKESIIQNESIKRDHLENYELSQHENFNLQEPQSDISTVNRITQSNHNKIKYKSFITEINETYNKYDKNDKHNNKNKAANIQMNKAQSCRFFSKIKCSDSQNTFQNENMIQNKYNLKSQNIEIENNKFDTSKDNIILSKYNSPQLPTVSENIGDKNEIEILNDSMHSESKIIENDRNSFSALHNNTPMNKDIAKEHRIFEINDIEDNLVKIKNINSDFRQINENKGYESTRDSIYSPKFKDQLVDNNNSRDETPDQDEKCLNSLTNVVYVDQEDK